MEVDAIKLLFAGMPSAFESFATTLADRGDIKLNSVDTNDSAVQELRSSSDYNALVMDYATPGLDVWRLSAIIRSGRFCREDIRIFLICDAGSEQSIPFLLCRDRTVSIIQWDFVHSIPEFIEQDIKEGRPTLLIIEDDPGAAEIATHTLQVDYQVRVASCGVEGLDFWQMRRNDVVVLDLKLPDMAGERVLDVLVSTDPHQAVVIVTAYSQLENHKNLMLKGASEFVGKPYHIDQLSRACRMAHNQSICLRAMCQAEDRWNVVSKHTWAAQFYLNSGHIGQAKQHINEVLGCFPMVSDDDRVKIANNCL